MRHARRPHRHGLRWLRRPHAHIHLVPVNGPGQLDPNRRFPATDDELHSAAQTLRTVLQDLRVPQEIQT